MKKKIKAIAEIKVLSLLVLSCVIPHLGLETAGADIIANPGFEKVDEEGNPADWSGVEVCDQVVRSGRYAAYGTGRATQRIRVEPDTKYRITVWAIMPGSNLMRLEVFDAGLKSRFAYTDSNGMGSPAWGSLPDWTKLTLEFNSGNHRTMVLRCGSHTNTEFWLDDFKMTADPEIILGDIGATDPKPKIFLDDRERGFIVFDRPWMERISSSSRPGENERTDRLSIRLTPGQYGPMPLAVYAISDLTDLELILDGPLTGPDGQTIEAADIDIKTVRMSRHHRSSTQWEVIPLFLPPAEAADLTAETTRLFRLTARAPEDAKSGEYRGSLRVRTGNRGERRIPVSIQVLPFRLAVPPIAFGMYHPSRGPEDEERHERLYYEDMKARGMTTVGTYNGFRGVHSTYLDPDRGDFSKGSRMPWDKDMEMLLEIGLPATDLPIIYPGAQTWWLGGPQSYPLLKQHRRAGWPTILHYVFDEPGGRASRIRWVKRQIRRYTHPDIRTTTSGVNVEELGRLYDVWIQGARGVADPEGNTWRRAREWNKELWAYECNLKGANPFSDRYLTGVYTWKTGVKGMWQWAYIDGRTGHVDKDGEWRGTDNHLYGYVIPSPDGPIPTVGWEARREGIYDYRYLYTLKLMSEQALTADEEATAALGEESLKLLSSIERRIDPPRAWEGWQGPMHERTVDFIPQPELQAINYEAMRRRVAEQILKLYEQGVRLEQDQDKPRLEKSSPRRLTEQEEQLHAAAIEGDIETVKRLIADDVDVNIRESEWGWSPLHQAAKRGHAEIIAVLLEQDAEVNARDPLGWSVLQVAAERGRLEAVKLLLDADAEIDIRDDRGRTPLMYAAYTNRRDIAELLLRSGADVNAADQAGNQVLHWAVRPGHTSMVELLLEHGANINGADQDNMTALHLSGRFAYPELAGKLLAAGAAPDRRDRYDWTPLHWATLMGEEPLGGAAMAEAMLENGVDPDVADPDGRTPLHWTAFMRGDHSETTAALLKHKAAADVADNEGNTALHWAVIRGHDAAGRILVEGGADLDIRNDEGRTPLHLAALHGRVELTRLLLENGADRRLRDKDELTPLQTAEREDNHRTAQERAAAAELLRR